MLGISELYGGEEQVIQRLINNIGFGIHVALPAVVQSYNAQAQTVECQPTIRERVIKPNGEITYMEYPLLVNVPVAFPQAGAYSITFPVSKGDECIVLFSDLSIDNWWKYGNVQNPVEQRRHDLSDGMAIMGVKNQAKLQAERDNGKAPPTGSLAIYNSVNGVGVTVGTMDGSISAMVTRTDPGPPPVTTTSLETVSFSSIIRSVTG